MNRLLQHTAFAVGLLTLGWVASGYLPGSPLALALVALIAAFFLMGALELRRFHQAGAELDALLARTTEPPAAWGDWLAQVPAALRGAVRLRVEGERAALPGPALTPYLTGLLVLLGMLGTFLGMVVTLKGTGLGLENASDVAAIRASLAAPVKGLGLAFGTSVAGVAASAMLGLMSALARRERQRTAQTLDARIAGPLRVFSRTHQREESLRLLGAQADAMGSALPALARQIESLVTQVAQQGQALHERMLAEQREFHGFTQRTQVELAASVGRSLQAGVEESARLTRTATDDALRTALTGLASEATALRDALGTAVQTQLNGTTQRLEAATAALSSHWQAALAAQQHHGQALGDALQRSLEGHANTFEARAADLLDGVAARLDAGASQWAAAWAGALERQQQGQAALLAGVSQAHATLASDAATRDAQRLQAFQAELTELAATLHRQGETHVAAVAARQQQICDALERTALGITAQAASEARTTLAEVARLMDGAAEAPRAAAQVIAELRVALSDSLVRDNTQLEERGRLLGTLSQLLEGVNHASTEQRAAIDALVKATTDVLGRASAQFTATVDAEARSLHAIAAEVSSGAAEVASLGEGFGLAVQMFSQASEAMTAQLQRIEAALGHSLARSDEQLAYYVAQARGIVDLTLGAQKQIVEDLQRLAAPMAELRDTDSRRAPAREVRA